MNVSHPSAAAASAATQTTAAAHQPRSSALVVQQAQPHAMPANAHFSPLLSVRGTAASKAAQLALAIEQYQLTQQHFDAATNALTDFLVDERAYVPLPPTNVADRFRLAVDMLTQRCQQLSDENNVLVHRLHYVKRLARRGEKDVAILQRRLDSHRDDWRSAQPEDAGEVPQTRAADEASASVQVPPGILPFIDMSEFLTVRLINVKNETPEAKVPPASAAASANIVEYMEVVESEPEDDAPPVVAEPPAQVPIVVPPEPPALAVIGAASAVKPAAKAKAPATKDTKRKRQKNERERDPNAPKRPANPFFQFCQEQRSVLHRQLLGECAPGEGPSKQELTRQLASRWRTLDAAGKQIYIDMYDVSKRKYMDEMSEYRDSLAGVFRT